MTATAGQCSGAGDYLHGVPVGPLVSPVIGAIFNPQLNLGPRVFRQVHGHVQPFVGDRFGTHQLVGQDVLASQHAQLPVSVGVIAS